MSALRHPELEPVVGNEQADHHCGCDQCQSRLRIISVRVLVAGHLHGLLTPHTTHKPPNEYSGLHASQHL